MNASVSKDAATVVTSSTFNSLEGDGMSSEFSSQIFRSTSKAFASSGSLRESGSSIASSLRNSSRSAELKLLGKSSAVQVNKAFLSELTINKLHVKSMGLIGREREIESLKSAYQRMMAEDEEASQHLPITQAASVTQPHHVLRKELVFVKGYGGVGKSSLVKTLAADVNATKNGIFGEGKFDLKNSGEPFSGIAAAFGEVCERIVDMQSDEDDSFLSIGPRLASELGSGAELLSKLIPELEGVLPATMRNSSLATSAGFDIKALQERVKYAFRVLTRVLTSEFSPTILVLDDLQWADVSSLEVMDFLISDSENTNALMIIGCYRSNEVDENTILFNRIQTMEGKKDKFNFNITDITLSSCSCNDVNRMIMSMMSIDDEEITRGLAEVCFKRTAGNPFFLIEFMLMLQSEGLIEYNLGLLKWIWDEDKIADSTMSAANVVDLLQVRMRKMSAKVQLLLQYAACLGSSFSISTLEILWNEHGMMNSESSSDSVAELVCVMLEGNFIEPFGSDLYRWVHDKVQEAAMSLSDVVNGTFQFEIGTALYHSLDEKEMEEQLFDVADLINRGRVTKRSEFAQLNLRAAEKARIISAFHSAAKYAANGIQHLPSDKWTSHRKLTLRLYTIGAEVELALGNGDSAEIYSNEVLNRKDCSTLETFPLKMAQAAKLCTVDLKFNETIEICLDLLKEFGCKLLWTRATTPVQAVSTLLRTIKMAKKAPASQDIFEVLGPMKDPRHCAIMHLLARLGYACYHGKAKFLSVLGACKIVEMTLKHGVFEHSAYGFTGLGLMAVAVLQDFETASAVAEIGLAVPSSREAEAVYLAHAFCLPWTKPFQSCLAPLADGYTSGMRIGDAPFAMWNLICHHVWMPYIMGKRLNPILEECPRVLSQMEEASQPDQAMRLKIFWQMLINLTTPTSIDAESIEGGIFSSKAFTDSSAVYAGTLHFAEGELFIFNDFEAAAKRAIEGGNKYPILCPGVFLQMIEYFHRAVSLYVMARRTKKFKYKNQANRIAKKIEKWAKGGNPNVRHYHLLLSAEKAALKKQFKVAEENYKKAIVLAARSGHLHHAGLCNELYADFLLKELLNEEEAKYRLGEAIRFYKEWGALGKVEKLKLLL